MVKILILGLIFILVLGTWKDKKCQNIKIYIIIVICSGDDTSYYWPCPLCGVSPLAVTSLEMCFVLGTLCGGKFELKELRFEPALLVFDLILVLGVICSLLLL